MIVFQNTTKVFSDGSIGLDEVNLKIKDKEFVFFIGPSGAGKTTIMRLLRREMTATSGNILVDETNLAEMSEAEVPLLRRKIGMCFQDFKLLHDRTVHENIALSLEILEKSDEEINEQVAEVLKNVDLEKKGNFFPIQLSGGELQRVGIARALVGKPEVLIADEPTGNLDPKAAFEIIKLFKEINLAGTTVLIATHNAEMVDKFEERVISLKKGKVVRDEANGKYKIDKKKK